MVDLRGIWTSEVLETSDIYANATCTFLCAVRNVLISRMAGEIPNGHCVLSSENGRWNLNVVTKNRGGWEGLAREDSRGSMLWMDLFRRECARDIAGTFKSTSAQCSVRVLTLVINLLLNRDGNPVDIVSRRYVRLSLFSRSHRQHRTGYFPRPLLRSTRGIAQEAY